MSDNPYQAPLASSTNDMIKCVGCSRMLHITASSCPECGANQRKRGYKSKAAAALLAFFFGGFGVHRFYLRQWWGVFYLLFFIFWIPGLIALIEMIVFLCTDQVKWDAKYNEGRPRAPGEGGGSGVVIALVLGLFVFIAIIGIVAAIAIPAYQDYSTRAKVAGSLAEVRPVKRDVSAFYQHHKILPNSNIMLGLDEPLLINGLSEITVNHTGSIVVTFYQPSVIEGATLIFTPEVDENTATLIWACTGGDLQNRFRPTECRN